MTTAVSRNYARALFDLARETRSVDEMERQLRAARQTLHDERQTRAFLSNRLVSRATKKRLLRTAFEGAADERLLILLSLLVERGRTPLLGEIDEEFERLSRLARHVQPVTLTSAFPLGEQELQRARRALEVRLGAEVELEVRVDPALVGGVVAVSEGREAEFSVEGRLHRLQKRLREAPGSEAAAVQDPSGLTGDPSGLKGDPSGLTGDPSGLKGDPSGLKG